ncbi:MAG: diguanylate cyclase, partial [Spirochaetaceae bacterium]|nr:diguanylate cyclase [Spirochaetaceae bacterium]
MQELESFKNIQRSILNSLLRVLLFIAALALTAVSLEELPQGEYVRFFLIYLPSFMMLMAVTLMSKKIPFNLRVYILISIIMLIGISEMLFWGFSSMAFYFFLSAAVIAAIINSPSLGWITFSCSLLIIVVFMLLYSSTSIPEYSEAQLSSRTLVNWIAPFITYIMLQAAILLIIQIIISHLIKTLIISSKEREELEQVAFVDTVTGLPNNQKVIQDIGKIIAGNEGSSFKIHLLLIEIVDFEDINIKYGLDTGNYILKIIAHRLLKLPECVVYRMTGSKFLIHCTKENELDNERTVEQVFKEPISAGHHIVAVHYRGASIRYPEDINNPTLLISNLMLTLNNAKSSNRDIIINYSETDNRKILRENDMKDLLVNAINKNEISVYIQPRMNAKTGLITGGELLMRWFNSKFGTISPTEFIPIAEKDEMI